MDKICTTLRLPETLHKKLQQEAERIGVSLNEFICFQLDRIAHTFSEQTQSPC